LHARYAPRIRGLVDRNWPPSLQTRCDSDDIVQEVFGRFFRAAQRGLIGACPPGGVWGYLLVITLNQIRKTAARHRSARRDVRLTVGQGGGWSDDRAQAARPCPDSRLFVRELLDSMPREMRTVVEKRLEGFTVTELAREMMLSQRSAERLLQAARRHVGSYLDAPPNNGDGLLRIKEEPDAPTQRRNQFAHLPGRIKIA
jgi:DNA-directed RNA polymerase specialized sigma24 family protein